MTAAHKFPKPTVSFDLTTSALLLPFAAQRGKVEARHCSDSHDRFLVLDNAQAVHLGCSINGLGKKAFMLSEVTEPGALAKILENFKDWWAKGQPVV